QYGVNVNSNTDPFVVQGVALGPFPNLTPTESYGMFIGDGTQSNFIKVVLTENAANQKLLRVVAEYNDNPNQIAEIPVTIANNIDELDLFILVNPANGAIQVQYSLDGGSKTMVGSSFNAQGAILTALQNNNNPLAVGILGTADSKDRYAASWDLLNVVSEVPFVKQELANVDVFTGANNQNIELNDFFGDNGALSYEAQSSNNDIGVNVNGSTLTLSFPNNPGNAIITVTATDGDDFTVQQTFNVAVTEEPDFVVRINAGPASAPFTDTEGNVWGVDQYFTGGTAWTNNGLNSVDILNTTDDALYKTERSGADGWTYNIPVPGPGTYQVNLHLAEVFFGVLNTNGSPIGKRVFTINMEGNNYLEDYDINADVGPQTATIKTFNVEVNDGFLTIIGSASTNQPKVSAIMVTGSDGGPTEVPIVLQSLADQTNTEGDQANLTVIATGGDGNINYEATGLPPGVQIEPTNGLITGDIPLGAAANSPYNVTITVDDSDDNNADAQSFSFTWTVNTLVYNSGDIVFRVNAGGGEISDATKDWSMDQADADSGTANGSAAEGTPSPYVNAGAQDLTFGSNPNGFVNNTGYPNALFNTERYNNLTVPADMMQWDFPVPNGDYTVYLIFAERWSQAETPGTRVFDVEIEDVLLLDDFDQTVAYGWNTAGVEAFNTTVNDGVLDIDFIKSVQNPNIKAIEIVAGHQVQNDPVPTVNLTAPTEGTTFSENQVTFSWTYSDLMQNEPIPPPNQFDANGNDHFHVYFNDVKLGRIYDVAAGTITIPYAFVNNDTELQIFYPLEADCGDGDACPV
ncbi:MAG: malectin domain-containing carbohydrate-binding protein, partial [Bacteroidota bacterium]